MSPPTGDPPKPEDLVKALQDLENSASSDAIVREKIARLPPEVSEAGHLEKLESMKDGKKLMKKVSLIFLSVLHIQILKLPLFSLTYTVGEKAHQFQN